jgi:hypothetical protein
MLLRLLELESWFWRYANFSGFRSASINKYGLTLVLSYAQRENLNLLRRILTWAKGHMRALSPDGAPPEEFSTGCFASHLPHARMWPSLGLRPARRVRYLSTRAQCYRAWCNAAHALAHTRARRGAEWPESN